jgi:PAS domain S-box-containing protein
MGAHWKEEFKQFLAVLPLPACLFDPDARRFVAANASCCELLGYTEQELIDLPWPQIMADDNYAQLGEIALVQRQETTASQPVGWALGRKDGSVLQAQLQYRLMMVAAEAGAKKELYFVAVVGIEGQQTLSATDLR